MPCDTRRFGGIAQLVEHPVHTRVVICSSQIAATRPVGQKVKTPPFHGGNMGSIPVRVTKKETIHSDGFFFGYLYVEPGASGSTARKFCAPAQRRHIVPPVLAAGQNNFRVARSRLRRRSIPVLSPATCAAPCMRYLIQFPFTAPTLGFRRLPASCPPAAEASPPEAA